MLTKEHLTNREEQKTRERYNEEWSSRFSHDSADSLLLCVCVVCFCNLGQAEPDTTLWISFYLLCHPSLSSFYSLAFSSLLAFIFHHSLLCLFSLVSHFEGLLMVMLFHAFFIISCQCPWPFSFWSVILLYGLPVRSAFHLFTSSRRLPFQSSHVWLYEALLSLSQPQGTLRTPSLWTLNVSVSTVFGLQHSTVARIGLRPTLRSSSQSNLPASRAGSVIMMMIMNSTLLFIINY